MAGHSKCSNIKHRKAAQDSKRAKVFTKIIRELVTATKLGGCNLEANPRLRVAVEKALSNNMTRDSINRAIKRDVRDDSNVNVESVIYEGYAPGGVAIMIECLSENRNHTVAEVRYAFTKFGGNLGADGSVAYLFSKKGIMTYASGVDEAALMEASLEAGAEDIICYHDGTIDVLTDWESLGTLKNALSSAGFEQLRSGTMMIPSIKAKLGLEASHKLLCLIDVLEDLEDVQEVHHNGEIYQEILLHGDS